jgi:hypothetical protein
MEIAESTPLRTYVFTYRRAQELSRGMTTTLAAAPFGALNKFVKKSRASTLMPLNKVLFQKIYYNGFSTENTESTENSLE